MTPGFSALTLRLQDCAVVPTSYWLAGEPSYWPNPTHVSKRSTNIGASGAQLHQVPCVLHNLTILKNQRWKGVLDVFSYVLMTQLVTVSTLSFQAIEQVAGLWGQSVVSTISSS